MERIAPLRLAESWDNVGLLLAWFEESPPVSNSKKILLTIDLTPTVAREAINSQSSLVIAYHPTVFRPLASLPDNKHEAWFEESPSVSNSKKILLTIDLTPTVAREAIDSQSSLVIAYHPTIFRPLSSLTLSNPLQRSLLQLAQAGISVYSPHTALDSVYGGINDWLAEAFVEPNRDMSWLDMNVTCLKDNNDSRGASGRLLTLPLPVQVTRPYENPDRRISTIAICAGSGGSMFEGVDADLYFTGEMQHHEVLAARAKNRFVLLCGHTNTERGYLKVLRQNLLAGQKAEPDLAGMEVEISKMDEHPLVPM
ncbi:hypothetical protein A7U60_g5780 [Sanghuangporus baumii]|uniref:Uncharacterized protein n=1 Tax=Sanghuangporus baumii TaxID=108892 RepID=A0A9Q5N2W8_SANBA|nr:hypothetical protein A7U60_g5780 [Sanghuangporus baumii]